MIVTVNREEPKPVVPPVKDVTIVLNAKEAEILKVIMGGNGRDRINYWVDWIRYDNPFGLKYDDFHIFSTNLFYDLPKARKI